MIRSGLQVRAEPLKRTEELAALDEESGALRLADFDVEGLWRYSFIWPGVREAGVPEPDVFRLLEQLHKLLSGTSVCVAGWRHGVPEELRRRHTLLSSRLKRQSWAVNAEPGIGVAMKATPIGSVSQTIHQLRAAGQAGWFMAFDAWKSPIDLHEDPFRKTIQSFCWSHRLQPSKQFLEGLREIRGAVAYVVDDDMKDSRVILITPRGDQDVLDSFVHRARGDEPDDDSGRRNTP